MRPSQHETADAILRLQSTRDNCDELSDYQAAARDLAMVRGECDYMLAEYEERYLIASVADFALIERLEYLLLEIDADCRPLE